MILHNEYMSPVNLPHKKGKRMKELKWILIAGVIIVAVIATERSNQESDAVTINDTMNKIGQTMETLFPIIFNVDKFNSTDAHRTTDTAVKQLSMLFKEAKPHFATRSSTYRVSFDVISGQLEATSLALKHKNLNHARNLLKELVSICASCHTQDTNVRVLFKSMQRSHFASDLEYAEFNYMTRNYNEAIVFYDKHLLSPTPISEAALLTAIKRLLTIYTQVYNQPSEGEKQLAQYSEHRAHTKFSQKSLEQWILGLQALKAENVSAINTLTQDIIEQKVTQILGNLEEPGAAEFPTKKEKVARVWLRGLLYHYLNTAPPEDEIPAILYWLAIIDRSTHYSFYYSLADSYLKECMLRYSSHFYAKKCYQEYEQYLTFAYSGSRGTDIPEDVQQELKQLKIKVYGTAEG